MQALHQDRGVCRGTRRLECVVRLLRHSECISMAVTVATEPPGSAPCSRRGRLDGVFGGGSRPARCVDRAQHEAPPVYSAGKNDAWNGVYGGLAAGAVLGLRARRVTFGVGSGVALAAASVVCDITGGHLSGKPLVRSPWHRRPAARRRCPAGRRYHGEQLGDGRGDCWPQPCHVHHRRRLLHHQAAAAHRLTDTASPLHAVRTLHRGMLGTELIW